MKMCPKGHGPLKVDGYRVTLQGSWVPRYAECPKCHAETRRELKRLVKEAQARQKEKETDARADRNED